MIIHRLASKKKGDDVTYFISCLADTPHSPDDHHWSRYKKKANCPACLTSLTKISYAVEKRNLGVQLKQRKDFRLFLVKNDLLRKYTNNCLKQGVKILNEIDSSLIRNAFDWSKTPEGKIFWKENDEQWLLEKERSHGIRKRRSRSIEPRNRQE